jgi:formate/nitrite transporter FocA (FNT family)
MADSGTEGAPRLDALLPPEIARRAEETGGNKVPMDALDTLALAVLAGGLIPS